MALNRPSRSPAPRALAEGLSLIELMIAMVLGLIVAAAAGGTFLANKRVYAASETLNRVQEGGRVSFELMSRDIRESGGSPCGTESTTVNLLNNGTSTWWSSFADGLHGYDAGEPAAGTTTGSGDGQRVAGTDAIDLYSANASGDYVIVNHGTPSATLQVTSINGLKAGEIVIACNAAYTLVFQITGFNGKGLNHNGGAGSPGNCGQEFQYKRPEKCAGASNPYGYCFSKATSANCDPTKSTGKDSNMPAVVAKVGASRWYIGNNARGSRSLYRAFVIDKTGTGAPSVDVLEEIAEGVTDMQVEYRISGSTNFVPATGVVDWKRVLAVRVTLVSQGVDGALTGQYVEGTDGEALSREFTHVVALRNREGVL